MNYAGYMELIDRGYFEHWNNRMRFFSLIQDHKDEYGVIDLSAMYAKGRSCNIELKTRTCDIFTFDTIFIEDKKWDALYKDWNEKNIVPLYICFMKDGFHVWLCDLRKYFTGEKHIDTKKVDIDNKGYNRIDKDELRYLIPVRDGVYYEFENEKYIRKW